jgi:NDP-sugar pyrophosphorylase family protein
MIPALLLSAGLATRLRPLSLVRAKPALPVAGAPLAAHILRWLAAAGVTDAVLNLHHLAHTLTRELGDGAGLGVRVRYSWEVPILGSAGGPKRALPLVGAPRLLIANGDTLTDAPVAEAVAAHAGSGALVTLVLVPNTQPDRYGGVRLDAGGAVTGFVPRGTPGPSYHFIGVQVVEAEAFASVPDGAVAESTREVYPALMAARPGSVRGHVCDCRWEDVGTPADYLATALAVAARTGGPLAGAGCHVAPSAVLRDTVLWDDVQVGAHATLTRAVVTDGARVPDGARFTDATVRPADGPLLHGERVIDGLAIGSLA